MIYMPLDEKLCEEILNTLPLHELMALTAFFSVSKELYPKMISQLIDPTKTPILSSNNLFIDSKFSSFMSTLSIRI
jgi:hypothetical protein